jgi:hypothetical protein
MRTFLSAVLLISAILCLLLVAIQDWKLRVGTKVVFSILFAMEVDLLINARIVELSGATKKRTDLNHSFQPRLDPLEYPLHHPLF